MNYIIQNIIENLKTCDFLLFEHPMKVQEETIGSGPASCFGCRAQILKGPQPF